MSWDIRWSLVWFLGSLLFNAGIRIFILSRRVHRLEDELESVRTCYAASVHQLTDMQRSMLQMSMTAAQQSIPEPESEPAPAAPIFTPPSLRVPRPQKGRSS